MFVLDVIIIQWAMFVLGAAARNIECHLNLNATNASKHQKTLTPIQIPDIFSLWKQQSSVQSN
jgi:hypothetical protein